MLKSLTSRLSLRVLAFGIIGTTLLSSLLLALTFLYIVQQVDRSEANATQLRELADPLDPAINGVVAALGYGGMVHDYKDAVLRGGPDYPAKAGRDIGAALAALDDVAALDTLSGDEVKRIRAVLHAYNANVTKVEFLRSVGTSPEQLDQSIRIDDIPAIEALHALFNRHKESRNVSKASIVRDLRLAMGYGGGIHAFKDYLLRGTDDLAGYAERGFADTRTAIAAYRGYRLSAGEMAALKDIEKVVMAYQAGLETARAMVAAGEPATAIDEATRVDDTPAVRGFDVLDRAVQRSVEASAAALDVELERTRTLSAIVTAVVVVGGVVISVGVGIILYVAAVRPAARIVEGMERLAKGETDVDFSDEIGRTEVGIIAGVAQQFGETLKHNQRLRAESEAQAAEHQKMADEQARLLEEQKAMDARMRADGEALAARQKQQDALQTRIGEAVSAAIGGDFAARVGGQYGAEDLDRLARHFNDLLASVARGVDAIAAVTQEMARGDLTVRMEGDFAGDFGRLQTGLNEALSSIGGLVEEVLSSADQIDSEAASIAAASADLSRRTETQAATLEETAAAVTQLSTSVKSVAENADEARGMANRAGEVADESGEVVHSAVTAMDRIVESSSKISKVTALIDDIAFQTNLLALNAGVEAARAGESGRGFAVVATEVRALAHRSSDAAKEINGLIAASEGEIGAGAEKISKAGESIREIASYVTRLREAIDSVANATSEQSQSLDEVNAAMLQLDNVTQQNVAMFEETTASTAALQSRSAELVQAGSRFRIGDEGDTDWQVEARSVDSARDPGRRAG
ncbi:methyl-accepting chemotaxis protein [Pseudooceanicola sp. LIPI14-2-Ac024]|uniref:methyl-accepting chemotaxis protein n=1 Tax=Pseudooceanicola sp. LIPI14-2-Ac024 TaxID=3344875 RepID=UPI0035CF16C3